MPSNAGHRKNHSVKRPKPIELLILTLRGQKVILDADLAGLYGTPTKALNQAIKRNIRRFPEDFLFRLTEAEKTEVVTNCDHLTRLRFSPKLPVAFTEHGAIMAAMVLNSPQAVKMSVYVGSRLPADARATGGQCGHSQASGGNRQNVAGTRLGAAPHLDEVAAAARAAARDAETPHRF